MKTVIYYDESVTLTHLNTKTVNDDYELQAGEVFELPQGFLTPAKLVDGKLTSATEEESQAEAQDYLKAHPDINQSQGASMTQQISMLMQMLAKSQVQNTQTQNQVKALQMMMMAQNKQIMSMKGSK